VFALLDLALAARTTCREWKKGGWN